MPRTANLNITSKLARSILSLLVLVAGVTAIALPSSAATSRTVSGTVACQVGHHVTGVWVQSSNGGSGWASWTPRSGAAWLADYSYRITTNSSSTSVRLDVGCGGTRQNWWSTNLTASTTVSGNKHLSALCKEAKGRAKRCNWWGKTVLVGMPFTGYWDRYSLAHPSTHGDASWGDWAVDLYDPAGSSVHARLYAPKGRSLVVKTGSKAVNGQRDHRTCTGSCTVGRNAVADVYLDGTRLGIVNYGHLADVPSTFTSPTQKLGTLKQWPYHSSYWQVRTAGGVHTHFAMYNAKDYACWWPRTSGREYPTGRLIGKLGATGKTVKNAMCTS